MFSEPPTPPRLDHDSNQQFILVDSRAKRAPRKTEHDIFSASAATECRDDCVVYDRTNPALFGTIRISSLI